MCSVFFLSAVYFYELVIYVHSIRLCRCLNVCFRFSCVSVRVLISQLKFYSAKLQYLSAIMESEIQLTILLHFFCMC